MWRLVSVAVAICKARNVGGVALLHVAMSNAGSKLTSAAAEGVGFSQEGGLQKMKRPAVREG